MESTERNRVFDRGELEGLLKAGTSLFQTASFLTEDLKTQVSVVKQYASRVPSEARNYSLTGMLSNIRTDVFSTDVYDAMGEKLTLLIGKIVDNAYLYDTLAAGETGRITECLVSLGEAIEGLKELLATGIIYKEATVYGQTLLSYRAKLTQSLLTLEEKLQLSISVLKGMQSCSELSMDPVNLSTGNFVYQKTDITIPGKAPLSFFRFYNAMDKRKGVLGRGWRHSFETKLLISDEKLILIHADGREESFEKVGKYRYKNSFAKRKNLHKTNSGYRYTDREGVMYTFDGEGKIIDKLDEEGNRIFFSYDEENRLERVSLKSDIFFHLEYHEEKLISVKDYTGRRVIFHYEKRKLCAVTDPCGGTIGYRYGSNNRITAIINEENIVTVRNEYDENRRVIRQTFPEGGTLQYQYQDGRNRTVYTEPNGNKKIYVNDNRMRNIATIHENGTESFEYDDNDRCTAYTDKNGNRTVYEYDLSGNVSKVVNALGETQRIQNDIYGHPIHIIYADGTEKKAQYDKKGRLLAVADEAGAEIKILYGDKEVLGIRMPDGAQEEISHDERGNITAIKSADGRRFSYEYDALNRVTASYDGNGNRTNYAYDACSRLVRITNPLGFSEEYTYK